jgi:hypothetical protein
MQRERDPGLIQMGVETGGSLEGPDVELVGIFERDFGFVCNRFHRCTSS